jgi:hypothetical protein
MAEQSRERNGEGEKKLVLLMDGQESLWQAGWDYLLPERDILGSWRWYGG